MNPEDVMKNLSLLVEALINEAGLSRRIVLEEAIIDYLDIATRETSGLKLPMTLAYFNNVNRQVETIRLESRGDVLRLVARMRELLDIASKNIGGPTIENHGGLLLENIHAFPITLTIQAIVTQMIQKGLFTEIETFRLDATALLRELKNRKGNEG